MRNRIIILVVALVITSGIVGIFARSGSTSIDVAGEETVKNTVVEAAPASESPVERVVAENTGVPEHEQNNDTNDISNLSRGYIDVDRSGDWSEGDIPLQSSDDGYIIPVK